jgi:tight adherence protein B
MSGFGFLLLGALLLLVLAGVSLFTSRVQRRRQQEMAERLEELRGVLPAEVGDTAAAVRALAGGVRGPRLFQLWQARADVTVPPHLLVAGGVALVALGAGLTWLVHPIVGLAVPALLLLAGIYALWRLASRRLDAFIEGLPFFLDALRQLLIVGNSMQQALFKGAENAGPDMQRYLLPMMRRINNGQPMPDAVTWLAARLEVPELFMLATAIDTNLRYGGRMSVVLANLIQILRDRARVGRELRAATAEIRFSAIVLGLMPMIVAVMITLIKPSYMMFFIENEQGPKLALIALGLQAFGILTIRRIMRLEY